MIIKDLNPFTIQPLVLNPTNRDQPRSLKRVRKYLFHMLKAEYERHEKTATNKDDAGLSRPSWMIRLSASAAFEALMDQLLRFIKGLWPFDRSLAPGESSLTWWRRLDRENAAQPLAVCIRFRYHFWIMNMALIHM
jgi:hypothetical protein